jgi:beta-galactosidase GanA
MTKLKSIGIFIFLSILIFDNSHIIYGQQSSDVPHLKKQETATQLIINKEPFLMLAGELGNSNASDLKYMEWIWGKVNEIGLNTLIVPVYWEFVEPEEGRYDFTLVDGLIDGARKHNIKLVFLWFGSWKNSMSCYVPSWVKSDQERFPRAINKEGKSMEMLSVFSDENRKTDARAFSALMKHICKIDVKEKTVLMIQVENEIGMIPDAREYTVQANKKFSSNVPVELINYLEKNKKSLVPELYNVWEKNGFKTNGTWEEVFGKNIGAEELFMAWHYALYVDYVVKAGKVAYSLPMYVNAALIKPGYEPGKYPSAGPLPHLLDIWRAGAPSIDFLSPDIYFKNFAEWCQKYDQKGNPLFIPEATLNENTSTNAFYVFGEHDAMGFSPFSIESLNDPKNAKLSKVYSILHQLSPTILKSQGKKLMRGFLLDEENKTTGFDLGDYKINVSHDFTFPWVKHDPGPWPQVGGMIISIAPDEFYVAGDGIILTFQSTDHVDSIAGIAHIDEGKFIDGKWVTGRRLNGDESHQGRHLRIPYNECQIQRIKLYRYH